MFHQRHRGQSRHAFVFPCNARHFDDTLAAGEPVAGQVRRHRRAVAMPTTQAPNTASPKFHGKKRQTAVRFGVQLASEQIVRRVSTANAALYL